MSTIRFNPVLGNIGAPLRDGSHEYDDEKDADAEIEGEHTEMLEMKCDEKDSCVDVSVVERAHDLVDECVAGPSRV